ncbi:BTAD domain-containing putative transcriptional regulator [Streptomyces kronopolitis]|uniref:BTAD domain-containing putative transcriptional regulator n=1 Tax=Streptomyces kronopolitis TaxID=1612435 RepID=UPI0036793AC3
MPAARPVAGCESRRPAGGDPHRPGQSGPESGRPGAREECFGVGPSIGHHHRQAPRVLYQAVAEGSLCERLSGRMVPTLHRCGRRTDALSVFGRLGGGRAERCESEPLRDLRRPERAILEHALGPGVPVAGSARERRKAPERAGGPTHIAR